MYSLHKCESNDGLFKNAGTNVRSAGDSDALLYSFKNGAACAEPLRLSQASTVHSRHFATLSDLWAVGVFADAFTWRWMSNGHVITSLATAPLQQPSFVPVFESGINSYTQTCRYVSYQCIRTKCL